MCVQADAGERQGPPKLIEGRMIDHGQSADLNETGVPLEVCVLVPATTVAAFSPQAVRLVAGLMSDPRYNLRLCSAPAHPARPLRPAITGLLAIERWLLPVPKRTPLPVLPAFPLEPRETLGNATADVVIDLSRGPMDRHSASKAHHGTWRIVDRPGASPLAASLAGAPASEALLIRDTGDGATARLVARATYDTKPLATHNVAYVAEKSAQMVLRELARCARDGTPADLGPAPTFGAGPLPGPLGYAARTLREATRRALAKIAHRRGRFGDSFQLRLGRGSLDSFDPADATDLPIPGTVLCADPFLIDHAGALWCFFEDVDPANGRGHISVGRVTGTGLADVQVALRQPHHMSFPFVFHHDGALLMVPEVHAAGRLEVWRSTEFPSGWELHATAFEGVPVADSVLFQRDGVWWLFTHISRDSFGDYCSDLHVFQVDGPALTRIVPHRLNPVVTDASTARGGGRVHVDGGRLIRISQDNSGAGYGYGFNVMEITRLDLDHYEERRLRHITPDFAPGLSGCHHLDVADGWFVIDVRRG